MKSTEKLANMQILSPSLTSNVEDACKNPVNREQVVRQIKLDKIYDIEDICGSKILSEVPLERLPRLRNQSCF